MERLKGDRPMMDKKPKASETAQEQYWKLLTKLVYLCEKIRNWLYKRKQRAYVRRRYLSQLEKVLYDLPEDNDCILKQEAWAMLYELKGDKDLAIQYRELEINLMEQLLESAQRHRPSTKAYVLKDRGKKELKERKAILRELKKND